MARGKLLKVLFVLFFCVTFTVVPQILAEEGATPSKELEVINSDCPVMGGAVAKDTPYSVVYNGKKIGFCCNGCVSAFNAEPEKYMAKVEKE